MLKYHIVGLRKLQTAVSAAPGEIATQEAIALNMSVELVKAVVISMSRRGPGHFGYHMADRWFTQVKVMLRKSTGVLKTDAPQARWLESGTKAHEITPSRAQALALSGNLSGHGLLGHDVLGQVVSRVNHPGEKATHELQKAYRASLPSIRGFFVGALGMVARSMATEGD